MLPDLQRGQCALFGFIIPEGQQLTESSEDACMGGDNAEALPKKAKRRKLEAHRELSRNRKERGARRLKVIARAWKPKREKHVTGLGIRYLEVHARLGR